MTILKNIKNAEMVLEYSKVRVINLEAKLVNTLSKNNLSKE